MAEPGRIGRRRLIAGAAAMAAAGVATGAAAQALRRHVATGTEPLDLVAANRSAGTSRVRIGVAGGRRIVEANGIPDHPVGAFPNGGNPHAIRAQSYRFSMPAAPGRGQARALGLGTLFGVAVNGVPFDPGAAEYWRGDRSSGWQYEALGGAVPLGLDASYGHVQPSGAYHYHGLPVGLLQRLGWSSGRASPLVGWAADGFPVYAVTAEVDGRVVEMTSSWRLRSGARPGGSGPGGRHDGTFVQDYAHVPGAGRLDACNGAVVRTAEFPQGTYAYFLTRHFPVIPRCLSGSADASFAKRR